MYAYIENSLFQFNYLKKKLDQVISIQLPLTNITTKQPNVFSEPTFSLSLLYANFVNKQIYLHC